MAIRLCKWLISKQVILSYSQSKWSKQWLTVKLNWEWIGKCYVERAYRFFRLQREWSSDLVLFELYFELNSQKQNRNHWTFAIFSQRICVWSAMWSAGAYSCTYIRTPFCTYTSQNTNHMYTYCIHVCIIYSETMFLELYQSAWPCEAQQNAFFCVVV